MSKNIQRDAEKAINKKAALGPDIDLDKYSEEENGYDKIDDIKDISNKIQEDILKVGIDTEEQGRAGTFLQLDQTNIYSSSFSDSLEMISMQAALDKHSWLKDYMWTTVAPDADKYVAQTALREAEKGPSGYFIRSLPGTKETFPLQSCMFIPDNDVMQTVHNVIIAEENSELNIITGCATGKDVSSALHVGVSEFILKPGSKVTFTMVHNWAEQVEVRPRTGVLCQDNTTYINNYILTSPVKSIQTCPTINCPGKNTRVLAQSILGGKQESILDTGAKVFQTGKGSRAEVISRAVSQDESKIYSRGYLAGRTPEVKGHVECHGLVLSDDSMIYAVPVLEGAATNLEMSHEAAVGKISEEEVRYLCSRGLTEDEAASMIVRGFLSMDIEGLPPELAAETQKMIDLSVEGM